MALWSDQLAQKALWAIVIARRVKLDRNVSGLDSLFGWFISGLLAHSLSEKNEVCEKNGELSGALSEKTADLNISTLTGAADGLSRLFPDFSYALPVIYDSIGRLVIDYHTTTNCIFLHLSNDCLP